MFYLEELLDPETPNVVIQQSWNDATDWPLNNKLKLTLHIDYPQVALDTDSDSDSDNLWIIFHLSVTQHASFNVSAINIE